MGKFSADFEERCCDLDRVLGAGRSYDVICRALGIGGRRAKLWVIDGVGQDAVLERITSVLLQVKNEAMAQVKTAEEFAARFVTISEIDFSSA